MVVEVTSGKGMHKRLSYAPETQLMIWAWSLVHKCVATVAALAREIIGICDSYISDED